SPQAPRSMRRRPPAPQAAHRRSADKRAAPAPSRSIRSMPRARPSAAWRRRRSSRLQHRLDLGDFGLETREPLLDSVFARPIVFAWRGRRDAGAACDLFRLDAEQRRDQTHVRARELALVLEYLGELLLAQAQSARHVGTGQPERLQPGVEPLRIEE